MAHFIDYNSGTVQLKKIERKRKPLTMSTKTNNKNKSDLPDVPIEKLDYKYLETCEDVEELRDIVAVLESGREGHFPDLNRAAEKKKKDRRYGKDPSL